MNKKQKKHTLSWEDIRSRWEDGLNNITELALLSGYTRETIQRRKSKENWKRQNVEFEEEIDVEMESYSSLSDTDINIARLMIRIEKLTSLEIAKSKPNFDKLRCYEKTLVIFSLSNKFKALLDFKEEISERELEDFRNFRKFSKEHVEEINKAHRVAMKMCIDDGEYDEFVVSRMQEIEQECKKEKELTEEDIDTAFPEENTIIFNQENIQN
jgi:hypothetical protein